MKKCEACENKESNTTIIRSVKFNKVLCKKHYNQMATHGRILKRTIYTPNEIVTHDKYAEIILYSFDENRELKETERAKIDLEDVDKCKIYKWGTNKKGTKNKRVYVVSKENGKTIYLHRFVMCPSKNMDVDHKNHDTFDNRKSELRVCTRSENTSNMKIRKGYSSKCKGVSWDNNRKKWVASITLKRKTISLGRYDSEKDACIAYNKKAKELFGEFSLLNNIS